MRSRPVPGPSKSVWTRRSPKPSPRGRRSVLYKVLLAFFLLLVLVGLSVFVYYYVRYSRIIDARLSGDVFNKASLVFTAPTPIRVGQKATPAEVAARLRRALYTEGEGGSRVGTYVIKGERLEISPGPLSYFRTMGNPQAVALQFRGDRLVGITSLEARQGREEYLLEPEELTTLFDETRSKRRLVRYQDYPKVLINAVLATEDHRFFSHYGVSLARIIGAALANLRAEDRSLQGGSTLTMQLARNFFLTRERTIRRKAAEIFLALLLEQRLKKEQILELYLNQVYLGQRGSFAIYGFGEAASAYFSKDVNSLTLAEAALLAGLIRGPNLYSPYKYPERAIARRNHVVRRMLETSFISASEAEKASAAPLGVTSQNVEASQAPYFVDLVKTQLLAQFSERELLAQSYRIYTTLDLDLQRAASEAVRLGMVEVDQQLKKVKRDPHLPPAGPNQPQVAMVALDPHSGEIKALVGGRDYGVSQLNHVLARRQPGSSFKPFVYAAALNSGVDGSQPLVTPATLLLDEPTTFVFEDQTYEPENYKREYHGQVTAREALTRSLNVATVRLAEMVGYDKVRKLAVEAGINRELLATPALALGAYVATPLEIAGAYTIFANGGEYVAPRFIQAVNDAEGRTLWRSPETKRPVLDPRVAYLMVSLLESVINNGTGAGVRSRGFTLPAAGKTGTSHDGWFVGFTPDLLAAVWVGYDDDRELNLPGASSALPVWVEFMKRAVQVPGSDVPKSFVAPEGVMTASVLLPTGGPGSSQAALARNEVFIAGTEPQAEVSPDKGSLLKRLFHVGGSGASAGTSPTATLPTGISSPDNESESASETQRPKKEGGILRKFLSVFKGGSSAHPPPEESKDSESETKQ